MGGVVLGKVRPRRDGPSDRPAAAAGATSGRADPNQALPASRRGRERRLWRLGVGVPIA